jgi:uncharacterized protein (UPF0212 family)
MAEIYCPNCGAKVKIKTRIDYLGIEHGSGFCGKCETKIAYENRSSFDQEGEVEVVLH